MSRTRLKPADRKADILDAAVSLAAKHGYANVTRDQIGHELGCAPSLVSHYFPTMQQLRRAIISAAIARRVLVVLAQGIVAREPKALAAPAELKTEAMRAA